MFTRTIAAALLAAAAVAPAQAAISLSYIGQQIVPTGFTALGTTVGGLSGIDYNAATNSWVALSDDRSQFGDARFYTLNLALTPTSFTGVTFTAVQTLKQPNGTVFPALGIDPEGIRFSAPGRFVYTSEGDANAGQNPFVREMNADGTYVRDFAVPTYYNPTTTTGIRNNLAFESITLSGDGARVLVATENALLQDGPAATATNGTRNRILAFDRTSGAAVAEYVYNADPIAVAPAGSNFATAGLTEFVALGGTEYLALERTFTVGAPGTGYGAKLYQFDLAGATNVLGVSSLNGASFTPVSKTLVLDLTTLGVPLDNLEGIAFGPTMNGQRTLVLVSDNNFGATQFTQFLAFRVNAAVPEPSTWGMMILGFGLTGAALRRQRRPVPARV